MLLAQSPVLLAITWVVWWVAAVGIGSWITKQRSSGVGARGWWGLLVLTVAAMVLALLLPLGQPSARIAAWALLGVGLAGSIRARLWTRWRLIAVAAAVALIAAVLSSVVPSNYDLGLYHAGSIAYVREGGTVIGLANLHDRFGFSSSMWPLSAFLGLGLWDGNEFRLVNGLLAVLLASDIAARLRTRPRSSPSTVVLTVGGVLLLGAAIHYPGRLIASSAQDWAAAVLMVVSTAYLLDVLHRSRSRIVVSISVLTAAMAGAMRPTGWIFAAVTLAVIVVAVGRSHGWRLASASVLPGVAGATALGIATAIRDALTSGWLLFPAGMFPLPVSWRYPDAAGTSRGITSWARTPFQDSAQTMADSSWVTGWLTRLPTDWAVFSFTVLAAALLVVLLVAPSARSVLSANRRIVVLGLTPSVVVLVVWLVTAPDPRFAWGPILLIVLVPLAFAVTALRPARLLPVALTVGAVGIVAVAFVRGSPLDASWRLQPLPDAQVAQSTLGDGTDVIVPVAGDQCWSEFPLCRPWYSSVDVELRGETWESGFQPISRLKESQE